MVINPVTSDLTTAAKTIITNPTFLPDTVESAAVFGGEAEASGALAAASPVMGVAGAALGVFGLGVGVGTLICHAAGIEGCLFDQADSADPTAVAYSWQWQETYAQWRWSAGAYNFKGLNGSPSNCGREPGAGYSYWKVLGTLENCSATQPDHKNLKLDEIELWRYGTANRTFSHVTDAQASSLESEGRVKKRLDPSESSTKEYGTKTAEKIKGHSGDASARYGEKIASQIAGSGVADPYALTVDVPNCDGLVYASCAELLEERELVPERVTRTWEDADVDGDPDEVLELDPAKSKDVEKGSTVVVTTNPDEAGMPIVIPSVEDGETYDHYAARLNPSLTPERHDLEAAFIDPSTGPNGVVEVSPEPETKLDPSTSHEVRVSTNPADAPIAAGAWSPPDLPDINFAPLAEAGSPCTVFPFGLLCWVGESVSQFDATGVCPHFSAPVAETGSDFEVTFCGETSETIMGYLRPAILLAFIVGVGYLFARATKAVEAD